MHHISRQNRRSDLTVFGCASITDLHELFTLYLFAFVRVVSRLISGVRLIFPVRKL